MDLNDWTGQVVQGVWDSQDATAQSEFCAVYRQSEALARLKYGEGSPTRPSPTRHGPAQSSPRASANGGVGFEPRDLADRRLPYGGCPASPVMPTVRSTRSPLDTVLQGSTPAGREFALEWCLR